MDEDEAHKPPLPVVPDKCGPPTIPLSMLLDFAVQQIFHEITVMIELLPKKQDAERKITLVQFAQSTRSLFVKLLATVKWVKSSKKFEHCASICYLLDQQAQYFVETADRLVMLAREELVFARLPAFQVCSAVDVLTQGTYSRLPLCIKQRFTKDPKISQKEQANVLLRINQVLQYRVSRAAAKLSPRIKEIRIQNGMATFVVPGEFEVTLTVLGETESIKWTLLNIKILVEDYEIGYGTQLVHPLQLNMIHNVLQSRMDMSKQPLNEVYYFLHSFSQSLQLDVLFCQSTQLATGRLRNKMMIEKYDTKDRVLSIGYWLQRVQSRKGQPARYVPQYRIQIYGDKEDPNNSLRVRHFPQGPGLGELDDRSGRLSIGRLLSETLAVRCRERLLRIRKRLEAANSSASIILCGEAVPILSYPILDECDSMENLQIAVNMFSGKVLCTVNALDTCTELKDLEKSLYDGSSVKLLRRQIDRLKILLMIERYKNAISCLQVRVVSEPQMIIKLGQVGSLPSDRIILQFIKEEHFYLIVTFESDCLFNVKVDLFLLSCIDERVTLIQLSKDHPALVAPMSRYLDGRSMETNEEMQWKTNKRLNSSSSITTYQRQLQCAVAAVDDRISFMRLCEELDRRGIRYKDVEVEPVVGGLYLQITDVSAALDIQAPEFFDNLIRCCLRLDNRARVLWPFECCLANNPLPLDFLPGKEGPLVRTWVQEVSGGSVSSNATSSAESVSSLIIDRLSIYAHIFQLVHKFSMAYKEYYHQYCSIQAYTYHKLVIAYGQRRDQLMVLSFKPKAESHRRFVLNFGQTVPVDVHDGSEMKWPEGVRWNAHAMMSNTLNERLNSEMDLVELVHYVISTSAPLSSLSNFARIRFQSVKPLAQMASIDLNFPLQLKYHMFAVNEYTVRLVYGILHLEFVLLEGNQVGIRDCARKEPNCTGLHQFFISISNNTAKSYADVASARNASPAAPGSLPPHQSIAASPSMMSQSLSVPPTMDTISSPHSSPSLQTTTALIVVDHSSLNRACSYQDTVYGITQSPLDSYLSSVVYLFRLGCSLDIMHRQSNSTQAVRFDSLIVQSDSIRISVTSASPSNPIKSHSPCQISFHIHIDPTNFVIKMSIEYSGESAPPDSDVRIMETYFERVVAKLNNEIAVLAYVNLCRITPNGALSSIAQIMNSQMDTSSFNFWSVSVQLSNLMRDPVQGPTVRKFRPGVIVEGNQQTAVKMLLCFRPHGSLRNPKERSLEKHVLVLVYNMQTNSLSLPKPSLPQPVALTEDEQSIITVLNTQNEISARTGECPLWNAVSRLLDRYSAANISGMPSSVLMPPSVIPPGSIGPIGSVGVPSIHNPLLNPGSNKAM